MAASASTPPAMPLWTGIVALSHLDQRGHDAAQRIGDAGQAGVDVLGVADDDHVGLEPVLVLLEEADRGCCEPTSSSPSTSILTLTGSLPLRLQEGGDGAELGGDGPLVVGGTRGRRAGRRASVSFHGSDCQSLAES